MDPRHYERLYGMRSRLFAGAIAVTLLGAALVLPGSSELAPPVEPPMATTAAPIAENPAMPPETEALAPTPATAKEVPATAPTRQSYVVQRGDCVWKIAASFCGSGFKWGEVYQANRRQIADPDLIYPNQKFVLTCKP